MNDKFQNLFDLKGEVAVVIGATGVLGGALAEGLAAAGADRRRARPQSRARRGVRAADDRARREGDFVAADAPTPPALRLRTGGRSEIGVPTVLVNAAGGNDPKVTVTAETRSRNRPEDWRANFDLNLVGGALLPCQEFGPEMVRRGKGSIINIASVSAHLPLSRVVAYSAAKAAVLSLTQFLAREWATKGVRVNSITPGFFPAEQNRALLYNADGTPRRGAPVDPRPHADGAFRRVEGTGRRRRLPRQPPRRQLRHRHRPPRRRRLPVADDLTPKKEPAFLRVEYPQGDSNISRKPRETEAFPKRMQSYRQQARVLFTAPNVMGRFIWQVHCAAGDRGGEATEMEPQVLSANGYSFRVVSPFRHPALRSKRRGVPAGRC